MSKIYTETEKTDFNNALGSTVTTGDKEGSTIGEYLHELLKQLWIEGEGFSCKLDTTIKVNLPKSILYRYNV